MSTMRRLIKEIRALPYADMMIVAEEIRERIKDLTEQKIEAITLAGILSRLQEKEIDLTEQTREEERVLKEIFRRKSAITIVRKGDGWMLDSAAVAGAQVINKELRGAFPMMLDQIITLHVLQK